MAQSDYLFFDLPSVTSYLDHTRQSAGVQDVENQMIDLCVGAHRIWLFCQ
jgi:hypothetical protein